MTSKRLQYDKYERYSGKERAMKTHRTKEQDYGGGTDGERMTKWGEVRSIQIGRGHDTLLVCPWIPNKPPTTNKSTTLSNEGEK